jgi:hemoglobin
MDLQETTVLEPRLPTGATTPTATTLYERLGRREGIARITHTLIDNHLASPVVGPRFRAADRDKLERLAIEFFCAGSGGPQAYTGRDMLATHKGMNISEQEFVAVVDDAMAALASHDIDPATSNEVLAVLWSLKGEVLRV